MVGNLGLDAPDHLGEVLWIALLKQLLEGLQNMGVGSSGRLGDGAYVFINNEIARE